MILTYPQVDSGGNQLNAEISFRFENITAVGQMTKYHYENGVESERVVPECCTIIVGTRELNLKANYQELLAKFKEYHEMYE